MPAPEKNQNAAKPEADKASSFLYIRALPTEKSSWVKAAKRAGQNLSEWVKTILNLNSQ
jgi:hypothetical protein